jgi:hypothetical protein
MCRRRWWAEPYYHSLYIYLQLSGVGADATLLNLSAAPPSVWLLGPFPYAEGVPDKYSVLSMGAPYRFYWMDVIIAPV